MVIRAETTLEALAVIEDDPEVQFLVEANSLWTPASPSRIWRTPPRRPLSRRGRQSRGSSCSLTAWLEYGPDSMRAAAPRSICRPAALSLPAVMQRLQVLKDSDLVRSETTCCVRTCRIVPLELCRAEEWMGEQRTVWEHRLANLSVAIRQAGGCLHR